MVGTGGDCLCVADCLPKTKGPGKVDVTLIMKTWCLPRLPRPTPCRVCVYMAGVVPGLMYLILPEVLFDNPAEILD